MHLFFAGYGYVASQLHQTLPQNRWHVSASKRSKGEVDGLSCYALKDVHADNVKNVTHIIVSTPPDATGNDPAFKQMQEWLGTLPTLRWIGYLSSTGVYGDHAGEWVTEESETRPSETRQHARLTAENNWLSVGSSLNITSCIFRLAGIYGPTRNPLYDLKHGKARRIHKPGQVFSRVHVDDIATALLLAIECNASGIFNLADDLPSSSEDLLLYAAGVAGIPASQLPTAIIADDPQLSPMLRSFYRSCRRICNAKAKKTLGWQLKYPDYGTALASMWREQSF